jgi:hypothetical protein
LEAIVLAFIPSVASFFIALRFDEADSSKIFFLNWWMLNLWCAFFYFREDQKDFEILSIFINVSLAHLLTTHTEKSTVKSH